MRKRLDGLWLPAAVLLTGALAACPANTPPSVACGSGTHAASGKCVPDSTLSCGTGTHADGGKCVADANVTCGAGTHLDGQDCVVDPPGLATQWGITTAEKLDSTGTDVLPSTMNHTYVYVNTGISFGATATRNGLHVFDYDAVEACLHGGACPADRTFLPIASSEIDTPMADGATTTKFSSHGLAMSPDGQWAYMPFLVPYGRYSFAFSNPASKPATWFYKLNARTLKPDKRIDCGGPTHHMNIVSDKYVEGECYSPAGVVWYDPANDDAPVKVFPWGKFEGYPYLSFESPPMTFLDAAKPPRYEAVTVMSHLNSGMNPNGKTFDIPGFVELINEDTMQQDAVVATGPFPVWVVFSKDGTMAWTSSADDATVRRIALEKNAATGALKATVKAAIKVGPGPFGLAISQDGKKLFVNDKAEGVRAGANTIHGSTVSVIDIDPTSPTYDTVIYTIALSENALTDPQRPDHAYIGPDGNLWTCANASQVCWVVDPNVEPPSRGGAGEMTTCERVRYAEGDPPYCTSDAGCPTGMPCDANGKCGGSNAILETLDCMKAPVLAKLKMPGAGEVSGWTTGPGDPHSLIWVKYDATGTAKVIQDFTTH